MVRSRFGEEDEVVLSELARVELMSVFHRRLRERVWSQRDFQRIIRQFSQDDIGGCWLWVPLDGVIVEQAVKTYTSLVENVFLRAADCLHLVTALYHGFTEIYTHDKHQIQAAPALGISASVIPP